MVSVSRPIQDTCRRIHRLEFGNADRHGDQRSKGTIYVGRRSRGIFHADGRELWGRVRAKTTFGHRPVEMKETRRIQLANGPGMTMFGPDGRYAFVCSVSHRSLTSLMCVHEILKRLPQDSPFCPKSP